MSNPTLKDYLDGDEPDKTDTDETDTDDYQPNSCEYCGRSFGSYGVRASKMLRKHEQRCLER